MDIDVDVGTINTAPVNHHIINNPPSSFCSSSRHYIPTQSSPNKRTWSSCSSSCPQSKPSRPQIVQHFPRLTPPSPHKRSRESYMAQSPPSYVKRADDSYTLTHVDGIFAFLPGSTVSFRISLSQLLRQSSGPKIFAFYGDGQDLYIKSLSNLSHSLRAQYDAVVYAVSVTQPPFRNEFGVPVIFDPRANLTRACRALHPISGGKHAMCAVVIVDSQNRKRTFLPVGYGGLIARPVAIENLEWVLGDALRYLQYEQWQYGDENVVISYV
ncbi:hypothetical protein V1514DRAFT_274632 [Lipomyces japonicus]|uniref:uncharacterized protein n=1 Tax=Lipomyces japonicus TaxID=56871 RepID=UPI0034CECD56